jgi:SAM-dependent methyltransferase
MQNTSKNNVDNPYHNPMSSAERRARYEYAIAKDCVLPMLENWGLDFYKRNVLDLGCGSGGLSLAMAQRGASCLGIDHNPHRISEARQYALDIGVDVRFSVGNILELEHLDEVFDLIVLSEVVEHLVTQANVGLVLKWCKKHLADNGNIYISFPPWFNPFGGHQSGWPTIRFIPWFHIFPDIVKKRIIPHHIDQYLNFTQELNKLTIGSFELLINQLDLSVFKRELYHIRPEYYFRYRISPIRALPLLTKNKIISEVTVTGIYYILSRIMWINKDS